MKENKDNKQGLEVTVTHEGKETYFTYSEYSDEEITTADIYRMADQFVNERRFEQAYRQRHRDVVLWTGPGGARLQDKHLLMLTGLSEKEAEEIVSKRDYPAGCYQISSEEPMKYLGYPDWANEEE